MRGRPPATVSTEGDGARGSGGPRGPFQVEAGGGHGWPAWVACGPPGPALLPCGRRDRHGHLWAPHEGRNQRRVGLTSRATQVLFCRVVQAPWHSCRPQLLGT